VDRKWKRLLSGSGTIPTVALLVGIFLLLAGGVAFAVSVVALSDGVVGAPTGFLHGYNAGKAYSGLVLGPLLLGVVVYVWGVAAGWIPFLWGAASEGRVTMVLLTGRLGRRRSRISCGTTVGLVMRRDRMNRFFRVVEIHSGRGHMDARCFGPVDTGDVEEMAQWLRDRGCEVTVRGSFDD